MGEAIILLGSNIDPARNIRQGALLLTQLIKIKQASSIWITPAIGTHGPDFYNAAVLGETNLSADGLKNTILRPLEVKLGRIRTIDKYAPRSMDLDVIILNDNILESRLWDTAFIMLPVAELVPERKHPVTGVLLRELAAQLEPTSGAQRLSDYPLFE